MTLKLQDRTTIDLDDPYYQPLKKASMVIQHMVDAPTGAKKNELPCTAKTFTHLMQALHTINHLDTLSAADLVDIIEIHHFLNIDETELSKTLLFACLENKSTVDLQTQITIAEWPSDLLDEYDGYRAKAVQAVQFDNSVYKVAMSADGLRICVQDGESGINIIRECSPMIRKKNEGHIDQILMTNKGKCIVSVHLHKSVRDHGRYIQQHGLSYVDEACTMKEFTYTSDDYGHKCAFSNDNVLALAGGSREEELYFFTITQEGTMHAFPKKTVFTKNARVLCIKFCSDGVIVTTDKQEAWKYNPFTYREQQIPFSASRDKYRSIYADVSTDGTLVMLSNGHAVELHDLAKNVYYPISFGYGAIHTSAMSADGTVMGVGLGDGRALFYKLVQDTYTCTCKHTLKFHNRVQSLAIAANGSTAIAGSFGNTAQVLDLTTGQVLHKLSFHGCVWSVALSANGLYAVAGSADKTARIVRVARRNVLKKVPIKYYAEQTVNTLQEARTDHS